MVATVACNKKSAIHISLIICLTAVMLKSNGQSTINLQRTIVIPANAIQLDSLIHLINKQAGVKFSINARKFPAARFIRIKNHKPTIAGILTEINKSTGVYYAVFENHIILLDNPPRKSTNAKNTTHTVQAPRLQVTSPEHPKRTTTPTKNPTVKRTPPVINRQPLPNNKTPSSNNTTVPASTQPIPAADSGSHKSPGRDTLQATPAIPVKPDTLKTQPPVRKQRAAANIQSAPPSSAKTEKSAFAGNLLIKGGLSADDIFYCNPTIQVGIPYVYGIASWSTNFKSSGFRYGLGGAIPLSDQWKLHLQVTTGNLSSTFDTAGKRWEFKTQLHRAGCIAEATLSPRLSVQFGPVFNLMKLTFYRAGKKEAPGLSSTQMDNKFNLLQPVYTITDNFSANRAQSTKTWIGFQVGLFFDLNFFKRE